ncbi:MAG: hypothetical protein KDJ20_01705 [Hyphomicrobiales bacterium]|nr:hypothetical protein [Methylobacteriaceae bacterium]MCC0001605.1 hypothetical protein [Methylobacteriaceae bacterium]MCC2102834.1 hypothetical protein [Hyphomicrobiales bacterium]
MRLFLILGFLAFAVAAGADTSSAQTSCSGFQSMWAKRCKQRVPGDANCVSDHCTPKLQECRSTGCWQEGRLYGGRETCNLRKS